MLKTNPFQMKRTIPPKSYSIVIKIVLVGIVIIATQTTIGQWRANMRAPVFVTSSGARSTIRYGSRNISSRSMWVGSRGRYAGVSSSMLPSERRFATYGPGRLPSEVRYSRFAPGVLPSGRGSVRSAPSSSFAFRHARTSTIPYARLGSIRYGTGSAFTPVYTRPQRTPAVVYGRSSPPESLVSKKTHMPNILYAAPGTIRYGTTKTSFSKTLIAKNNALSKSDRQYLSGGPKSVIAVDTIKLKPNLRTSHSLQGSIRYGSLSPTTPVMTGSGFVPKL